MDENIFASVEAILKKTQISINANGKISDEDRRNLYKELNDIPQCQILIKKFQELFPEPEECESVSKNNLYSFMIVSAFSLSQHASMESAADHEASMRSDFSDYGDSESSEEVQVGFRAFLDFFTSFKCGIELQYRNSDRPKRSTGNSEKILPSIDSELMSS
jgi:hypothetical protein